MYNPRVSAQEQYHLVMECRQSGLTDHQWCIEHNIRPGTFYNWVKRLRQKGCCDLPSATGQSSELSAKQEVVKLDFKEPSVVNDTEFLHKSRPRCDYDVQMMDSPTMRLAIGDFLLDIPNGTDSLLLVQTIRALKEAQC